MRCVCHKSSRNLARVAYIICGAASIGVNDLSIAVVVPPSVGFVNSFEAPGIFDVSFEEGLCLSQALGAFCQLIHFQILIVEMVVQN